MNGINTIPTVHDVVHSAYNDYNHHFTLHYLRDIMGLQDVWGFWNSQPLLQSQQLEQQP